MSDEMVILVPCEQFDGTVAEYRELLAAADRELNPDFPEHWPFPHDDRRQTFDLFAAEDRVRLGRVEFVEGGIAFRHILYELDGVRYQCLAVYGRRKEKAYPLPDSSFTWTRVKPFVVAGWRDAGLAVKRMFAHGVGVPPYGTADARGFDVVVLTAVSDGVFDWTSVDEPPHDLGEGVENDDPFDGPIYSW